MTIRTDFTNDTVAQDIHAQHHNDLATAVNGLVDRAVDGFFSAEGGAGEALAETAGTVIENWTVDEALTGCSVDSTGLFTLPDGIWMISLMSIVEGVGVTGGRPRIINSTLQNGNAGGSSAVTDGVYPLTALLQEVFYSGGQFKVAVVPYGADGTLSYVGIDVTRVSGSVGAIGPTGPTGPAGPSGLPLTPTQVVKYKDPSFSGSGPSLVVDATVDGGAADGVYCSALGDTVTILIAGTYTFTGFWQFFQDGTTAGSVGLFLNRASGSFNAQDWGQADDFHVIYVASVTLTAYMDVGDTALLVPAATPTVGHMDGTNGWILVTRLADGGPTGETGPTGPAGPSLSFGPDRTYTFTDDDLTPPTGTSYYGNNVALHYYSWTPPVSGVMQFAFLDGAGQSDFDFEIDMWHDGTEGVEYPGRTGSFSSAGQFAKYVAAPRNLFRSVTVEANQPYMFIFIDYSGSGRTIELNSFYLGLSQVSDIGELPKPKDFPTYWWVSTSSANGSRSYKLVIRTDETWAQNLSCVASGIGAHASGISTQALGNYSDASGVSCFATGAGSSAQGTSSSAQGGNAHAEGGQTLASGSSSHAEGQQSQATGDISHAEGRITRASGYSSHAEGNQTLASGYGAHSQGYQTQALGTYSSAIGAYAVARNSYSTAEASGCFGFDGVDVIQRAQTSRITLSGISATPPSLLLPGRGVYDDTEFTLSSIGAYYVTGKVVAANDLLNIVACFEIKFGMTINTTEEPRLVGIPIITPIFSDSPASTWSLGVSLDGQNINIEVLGDPNSRWSALLEIIEVS